MNRKKMIRILLPAAAVCIVLVLFAVFALPALKYNSAKALLDAGKYEEAIAAFESLGTYRDSAGQIEACRAAIIARNSNAAAALYESGDTEAAYALLKGLDDPDCAAKAKEYLFEIQKGRLGSMAPGDTLLFGSYEQDGDLSNGPEELEWIVLDADSGEALVISKYGLDIREFNDEKDLYSAVTWNTCQLRQWLNGPFYNSAFSPEHQGMILISDVPAATNPDSDVNPGRSTKDKVFILGIEEAYRYFDSDSARQCFGTSYCYMLGAEKTGDGACYWWLRSPGVEFSSVSVVLGSGAVFTNGFSSGHIPNLAVRPVMRISSGSAR